jgi:hypothetical protein
MPVDLPPPRVVDSTGKGRIFVSPPVIHVGSGSSQLKDIQFMNNTGGTVRIWLLNAASLFAGPPEGYSDFNDPFVVKAGGKLDLKLLPDLKVDSYAYYVYCDKIKGEAEGNSPPRIDCP